MSTFFSSLCFILLADVTLDNNDDDNYAHITMTMLSFNVFMHFAVYMSCCVTNLVFIHSNGHMLTHRNKKPYECKAEGCGKSYCDARSLRRHTENHHSSLAMTPTTPNQSLSSTGPLSGLSLSPATASGKLIFPDFIRFILACR